ncbi:hypothetical protein RUM43_001813 [Polyplax serrata]|uniref:Palmitoyl-protein thioesterase 1 n=1 Tax=Polyplax serrata TaxID=468196 RepID=A0AAN8XST7_POLSC
MSLIKEKIPDVEILSLKFGDNDIESGYFLNVNKQVEEACQAIQSNPKMKNGYNAIGFSQGGQFLRAVAQRCPNPPMKFLISLGGQHQGVYGLPKCLGDGVLCNSIRKLLNTAAYVPWVQDNLVQAQYWHDPLNEEIYRNYSTFIAEINNEKAIKNDSYITNLQKLETLVLVMFTEDSMVVPRESSWFGFYRPNQAKEIVPYNQTRLYEMDLIGFKKMVEGGKVDFLQVEGDHLQFTEEWFTKTIIQRYLM